MIERTSEEAFQALWIDIQFFGRPNIICGIIYRKHNSPQGFQDDFDEALETIGPSKQIGLYHGSCDFNINLLESKNVTMRLIFYFHYKLFFYSDNW